MKHVICFLIAISFLSSGSSFSQQSTPYMSDAVSTAELIKKAGVRVREYREKFKDLHAEETQKVEEYEGSTLKRQREVVSDLIVYQSQIDDTSMAEYRNVRRVDGKPVTGRDSRAERLFERLAKAGSKKKELDRINRESRRYDLNYSFYGFTLNQGLPLEENSISSFRFTVTGREQIDGREVIVVEYQQVAQIPGQNVKLSLPEKLKGAELLHRGRLWLDRETARLRREVREWTLKHTSVANPLTYMKFEFSYRDSRFEILTPTRISITAYNQGRDRADGSPELLPGGKVSFEYSEFRRFEVTPGFQPDAK